MSFRVKFMVQSITDYGGDALSVSFAAIYDPTIPEDANFTKWTPTGSITMSITNRDVIARLKPGVKFYVDFTQVEPVETPAS